MREENDEEEMRLQRTDVAVRGDSCHDNRSPSLHHIEPDLTVVTTHAFHFNVYRSAKGRVGDSSERKRRFPPLACLERNVSVGANCECYDDQCWCVWGKRECVRDTQTETETENACARVTAVKSRS